MKNFVFFILMVPIVSCNAISGNRSSEQSTKIINIDTVRTKERKTNCFINNESNYPQISGLSDTEFEKKLNNLISKSFYDFIDTLKVNLKDCPLDDSSDVNSMSNIPPDYTSWFETLTNSDSIISIIQNMESCPGGGGNFCKLNSKVFNIDIKKKIIFNNSIFKTTEINLISQKVKKYFDSLFPQNIGEIDYPKTEKNDFDKLNFGIRNDSIMLVIEAYPNGHISQNIYIIPLEKFQK